MSGLSKQLHRMSVNKDVNNEDHHFEEKESEIIHNAEPSDEDINSPALKPTIHKLTEQRLKNLMITMQFHIY